MRMMVYRAGERIIEETDDEREWEIGVKCSVVRLYTNRGSEDPPVHHTQKKAGGWKPALPSDHGKWGAGVRKMLRCCAPR